MTQKIKPLPNTQAILKNLGQLLEDVGDKVDEGEVLVAAAVYGVGNAIVCELVALRAELVAQDKTVVINKEPGDE